ncbi:hypothetical protein HG536_0H03310 [Torulaspora globosa]|uniref:Uncharacterized protein n=1 Tax=Torulaspora globosa TaxID=48254 RepID=A0A7G3ZN70_9SACH|nr:uncharacterized protein HG536_0H03310 [Torulaspora globosa]QLL34956.1 hypothetical protein HG536_0H03310 [Torulaspora globosa]
MNKSPLARKCLSQATRNALYLDCLNRKFDKVLKTVRSIPPKDMDYAFLQTYLARSCHWGHMASVSYIWYRYVLRSNVLIIKASLLCDIGNLSLNEGNHFIPAQLHEYFSRIYGKSLPIEERQSLDYELSRIKVESFAKGTINKTNFREKWKVFLEDIDHRFPSNMTFRARDFPNLGRSLRHEENDLLMVLLFGQNKIAIHNASTGPLLLNLILMYSPQNASFKISLFEKFYNAHRLLNYDDTVTILLQLCKGDPYNLEKIKKFAADNLVPSLSSMASKTPTNEITADTSKDFVKSR